MKKVDNYNTARDRIKEVGMREWASILGIDVDERNKSACPICPSSDAFHIYPNRFKCFSCGEQGDVIDLVGKTSDLNYAESVGYLSGLIGIEVENNSTQTIILVEVSSDIRWIWKGQEPAGEYISICDDHDPKMQIVKFPVYENVRHPRKKFLYSGAKQNLDKIIDASIMRTFKSLASDTLGGRIARQAEHHSEGYFGLLAEAENEIEAILNSKVSVHKCKYGSKNWLALAAYCAAGGEV